MRQFTKPHPRIAYLLGRFGASSETFITREVASLLRMGVDLHIYLYSPLDDKVVQEWGLEPFRDQFHLIGGFAALDGALRNVGRLPAACSLNNRFQKSGVKSNPCARLLRAASFVSSMRHHGITHIHAHWPYQSQIAALAHVLTGLSYSVSIHAHEVAHDNSHFPLIFPELSFAAFCNRAAMNYLMSRLPTQYQSKAHLVYHGVDLQWFAPQPWPPSDRPLQICSAGRLTKTKGFDRLIAGCAAARKAGLDVELTILGQGGEYEPLLRQAETLGFGPHLKMPGWVPYQKVRDFLEQTHVFALLADDAYHDGLPNVILEAMACGRPVISSPLPSVGEAIADGREGYVLRSPHDTDGFVRAVSQLSGSSHLLIQMGRAARQRAEKDHDADLHVAKLAALLREGGI